MASLIAGASAAKAGPEDKGNVRILPQRHHSPGSPVDVLDNYSAAQELFELDPSRWGGAYVDGDVLTIKYVTGPADQAMSLLRAKGITQGVKLVATSVSMAQLDAAQV